MLYNKKITTNTSNIAIHDPKCNLPHLQIIVSNYYL